MNLSLLRTKIPLMIAISILVTVLILVSYSAIFIRNTLVNNSKKELDFAVNNYSKNIKLNIELGLSEINTMGYAYSALVRSDSLQTDREVVDDIIKEILHKSDIFNATGTVWEPNAFDGNDYKYANNKKYDATGRIISSWSLDDDGKYYFYKMDDFYNSDIYKTLKKTKKEILLDPRKIDSKDNTLKISFISPIILDTTFLGMIGADMSIDFVQANAIKLKKKLFNGTADILVLSQNGYIAANTKNIDSLGSYFPDYKFFDKSKIIEKKDSIEIYNIINIGKTSVPWQVKVSVPKTAVLGKANETMITQLAIGIVLIIITILIAVTIITRMLKPLKTLSNNVAVLNEGKLQLIDNLKGKDEIAIVSKSFNTVIEKLKEVIDSIKEGANKTAVNSSEITDISHTISNGANAQAATTEQVSSSIEEITASINQTTTNTKTTSSYANDLVVGINELSNSMNKSIVAMQEIIEKISIIGNIAQRTNMLALNAAVEAARAGEHGKGFGVVAAEVKNLAQNAQDAAEEIDKISAENVKIALQSGKNLEDIIPKIKKTASLINEISETSFEQKNTINQINNAIMGLNSVTQQNATAADELEERASQLLNEATSLEDSISFFQKE